MLQGMLRRAALSVLPLALLVASGAHPLAVSAQETPDLVVSLRDAAGAGVAAGIIVRDASGDRDFARASTDAEGLAVVDTLPANQVRIAVEGRLPDGTPLVQPGDDARGLLVFLDAGTTRIDLRADLDGAVMPDPATMVAQESAAPDVAEPPAAPPAATLKAPTSLPATRPTVTARITAAGQLTPAAQASFMDDTTFPVGSFTLAGLLGLCIAVVLVLRGRM